MKTSLIDGYLDQVNWKVAENANIGFSLMGLNNFVTSDLIKEYWMYEIYDRKIRKAHNDGSMHIHDLGSLSVYCVGWDLYDILKEGFRGARGKIESTPAKHFSTALMHIVNFIFSLQGESAGAQAISNFDTLLAPFVRYDNLSYKQVEQELQMFLYNMNVATRVGGQSPFSNITMDLVCPRHFRNVPVLSGGEEQEDTYDQFQREMDIINKIFAKLMIDGDSLGRPFTFPIPTYNLTKDFNWDSMKYDPIWEMTAKRGTGSFSNFINSDMSPEDARSMCCRLRLDSRELMRRGGGLFGSNGLTGSIGVVTINMNQLAYLAKDKPDFFRRLTRVMDLAKDSLVLKRESIENLMNVGLYPYSRYYLKNVKKRFGKFWANHFSTIGLIGLNDAIYTLMGITIGDDEGIKFAIEVLNFMRDKLVEYQEETGDMFNLEATPAEGTSYRLAKIDRRLYPDIKIYNSDINAGSEEYYTNSSQLPVMYTDSIMESIEKQDEIQCSYTGGTVHHIHINENNPNVNAIKKIVRSVAEKCKMPYFTINPTQSVCPNHKFLSGEYEKCPECGEECEVISRVVGFFRPVSQWNKGKQQEFKDRKTFKV